MLQQAAFLVELFKFSFHNLGPSCRGFSQLFCLPFEYGFFPFDQFGRDILAFHIGGFGRGDLEGEIIDESFEFFVAGDEIRFAIDFDQDADFSAHMDIGMDQSLIGFPSGFLGGRSQAFLPEIIDRLFDVVAVFSQRLLAIQDAGAGFFTKFFYEVT